jgi:hypothetical protein
LIGDDLVDRPSSTSTYWRLATLPQQRQLRFRGADARHDAIEFDQSSGFISGSGFLHTRLRMVLSPALSRAETTFNVNSRVMKAVQRMFERCCVEQGPPNPSECFETSVAKRGLFETANAPADISDLVWRRSYSRKRAVRSKALSRRDGFSPAFEHLWRLRPPLFLK